MSLPEDLPSEEHVARFEAAARARGAALAEGEASQADLHVDAMVAALDALRARGPGEILGLAGLYASESADVRGAAASVLLAADEERATQVLEAVAALEDSPASVHAEMSLDAWRSRKKP